jgi:hypothetical protein
MLFREVYNVYFNVVAAIIRETMAGEMSEKRILEIIHEQAFSESMLSILPSIKQEEWLIINKEYQTPLQHPPVMPLTLLQKRWLKGLLTDPRISLFEPQVKGLDDVEPLFTRADFVFFDQYQDGDPYADPIYQRNFQTILQAIKEHRRLYIKYKNGKGTTISGHFIPYRLEFSAKDDKFRLLTAGRKQSQFINLVRIQRCHPLSFYENKTVILLKRKQRTLTFTLRDQRNSLERVMLHFSDCRKETCLVSQNTYQVTLWYDAQDETELLIRILSFGPMILVTAPQSLIEQIKTRLIKQKRLFE